MHKHIVLIIILAIVSTTAFGQAITLSGTLSDKTEKRPVENAVVVLLRQKDSVLYKFTRTDANGNFSIPNIKPGNYRLLTTHSLYADYVDSIVLKEPVNLGSIALINKSKLLEEVIIKSGSPIRIKGDTTVYTADSFKVRDGASVEELLRKMPGFQVGKDGQLKAQGETVKNVLVDGEEFFGNDPGMVLKNLQANAIQEVQVYDKKSDQAVFSGIDDGTREKTVNLKLKANKKQGYFGKAEVAGGTPENYNNSVMVNAFEGKRKISGYGFMSNTGRTGLGWGDGQKYGGSATLLGVTMDGSAYSGDDYQDYDNNNNRNGIPKNWNTGLHYSNKYKGDSLNINGSYRYSKIDIPGFTQTYSKTFLPDTSWANNSNSTSFNKSEKQDMNFYIERKIDSNNTIKFSTKGSINNTQSNNNYYEENLTNDSSFINNSTRQSSDDNKRINYQGTLLWSHKFKKPRRTFVALVNENISQSDGTTQLYALNNFYKGAAIANRDTIDQKTLNKSNSNAFATNLIYTEPLSKYLSLGFNFITTISNSTNNKNVFKKDATGNYTTKIDSLSNDFDYIRFTQRNGITLRLVKKKISGSVGTAIAFNNFKQNNNSTGIKQDYNFTNFFPTANFNWTLKGNKRVRFNYYGNTDAPSLEQLQPIADNSDPLNIALGNVNLKQSFTHNFSGGLQWFKPLTDNSLWSNFNYSTTNNAFTEFNRIDSLGRNIYQVVNVNGNKNYSANIEYNFSIGSGKKKIGFGIEPNMNFNRNIDYVNAIKNTNNNLSYSLRLSANKYVEDKFDFYIGSSFGTTHSTSSINAASNRNYWTFDGQAQGSIYITKKLSINSNADFNFRQKDPAFPQNNNYIKWNADVRKYIYKKEFSVKFGVNDLLNQKPWL